MPVKLIITTGTPYTKVVQKSVLYSRLYLCLSFKAGIVGWYTAALWGGHHCTVIDRNVRTVGFLIGTPKRSLHLNPYWHETSLFFSYYFCTSLLLSSHFSLSFSLSRRNSDPGSPRRLFSPFRTTARALIFIARRLQLFLPSSTHIELRLLT